MGNISKNKILNLVSTDPELQAAMFGNMFDQYAEVLYVDGSKSGSGDGSSWREAFNTIGAAVNKARYSPNTSSINYSKNRQSYIIVAPGQYNEQILKSGYNIHILALEFLTNGDYGTVINYDGAVTTTCVVGFTGGCIELGGFCIQNSEAIPALYLADTSDAVYIHDNWIKGDNGKTSTIGISCAIKNSVIENNIINGHIAGIDVAAGDWFNNSIVQKNKITNVTNGIAIAATAVCTESMIHENYVVGSTSSIVNGQATDIIITNNLVKPAISDAGSTAGGNTTLS
jgi:hypothetical protein